VKTTKSGCDETDVIVCCQQTHVVFGDLLSSMHRKVTSCHITYRVPTVRESQGILRESGKVRENREGQGKVGEF